MARPKFQPTDEQRKRVRALSAFGFRHEDICLMIGLRSPKSLRQHFRQELSMGMAEANAAVARTGYEMACSGRCLPMTIFWTKCNVKPEPLEDDEPTKEHTIEVRIFDKDGVLKQEREVTDGRM